MKEVNNEDIKNAQLIWDYGVLNHQILESDVIVGLGSSDLLPAEKAASLFFESWAQVLLFSGGSEGKNMNKSIEENLGKTSSDIMGDVAISMGVPKRKILYERKSQNTGENIDFTKNLLEQNDISPKRVIFVHMPYAERRGLATINKRWSELESVIMASPRVKFTDYHIRGFQGQMSQAELISDIMGDFQSTFIYAREGIEYMVPQKESPKESVKEAYLELVESGYTHQLAKDDKGKILDID